MNAEFYAFSKVVVTLVLRTLWRMRVEGAQHVPREGPLIVVANHVSYFDPPVLGCALPRELHFMAKKELFDIPLFGALIACYNAYPVERGRGDVGAIKRTVKVLKDGHAVLIFPEGRRNRDEGEGEENGRPPNGRSSRRRAQAGIAFLASLSGARVLPAYIEGTKHLRLFSSIKVIFGEPFQLGDGKKASRGDLAKRTDEIMERIFALRE
jgi:1-acyl-sn-glycerol-3-phosphate acyltransferase